MEKNKIKTSTGEKIFTVFNYAFFTLLCLVMLYPFWHEIMLSFSSLEASMKGGIFLWPKGFNLDTYKSVFKKPEHLHGLPYHDHRHDCRYGTGHAAHRYDRLSAF